MVKANWIRRIWCCLRRRRTDDETKAFAMGIEVGRQIEQMKKGSP